MKYCLICAVLLLSGCRGDSPQEGPLNMKGDVSADLAAVKTMRVFFGHQSVGKNLLDGLLEIARSRGDSVQIAALSADGMPAAAGIAHAYIGQNQDPGSKCDSFLSTVTRIAGNEPDVVSMKFCYVDIEERSDPQAIFDRYRKTIEGVREAAPRARILHMTAPLTARTPTWKQLVKRLLGRGGSGDEAAKMRAQFNRLMREGFPGDGLFDLARYESTFPDGRRHTVDIDGTEAEFLVDEYTSDGGHLNERGRSAVSGELLHVLASMKLR